MKGLLGVAPLRAVAARSALWRSTEAALAVAGNRLSDRLGDLLLGSLRVDVDLQVLFPEVVLHVLQQLLRDRKGRVLVRVENELDHLAPLCRRVRPCSGACARQGMWQRHGK